MAFKAQLCTYSVPSLSQGAEHQHFYFPHRIWALFWCQGATKGRGRLSSRCWQLWGCFLWLEFKPRQEEQGLAGDWEEEMMESPIVYSSTFGGFNLINSTLDKSEKCTLWHPSERTEICPVFWHFPKCFSARVKRVKPFLGPRMPRQVALS